MNGYAITLVAGLTATVAGGVMAEMQPRDGWQIIVTDMTHTELLDRLVASVPDEGMGVVTQAGPTAAARARC